MSEVRLDQLLEAGVHFGHQTRRWNPKMKPFIFTERNGIHIIDLRKTLERLRVAQQAVREVVLRGDRVLFICTKKQLRSVVEQEAVRCGSFFVTERWLGGMLTNFQTIRKQIRRLRELERGQEENAFEFYTKKERLMLDRERAKLDKGRGARLEAKGLESKRAEFSQPATATPTSARTATRSQARGRDGTMGRGMWLLTHTHKD